MALYIEYADGDVSSPYNVSFPPGIANGSKLVVGVQADGDELEFIRARFTNLPDRPAARVVEWYGDTARFIVRHLRDR